MKKRRLLVFIATPLLLFLGFGLYRAAVSSLATYTAHTHDQAILETEYRRLQLPSTFTNPNTKFIPHKSGQNAAYAVTFTMRQDPQTATTEIRSALERAGYELAPSPATPTTSTDFTEQNAQFIAVGVAKSVIGQPATTLFLVLAEK